MSPVTSRNEEYGQVLKKLQDLFQCGNENLNFGIYRFINHRQEMIDGFIENELPAEMDAEVNALLAAETGLSEDRSHALTEQEVHQIKLELYAHLIDFFSQYYRDGNLINTGKYQNEDTVLSKDKGPLRLLRPHRDQYYVKTMQSFTKYSFDFEGVVINFRVVMIENEKGNVKEDPKFYVLSKSICHFNESLNVLDVHFEYRSLSKEEREKFGQRHIQERLHNETVDSLTHVLSKVNIRILQSNRNRAKFKKHLRRFVRQNTIDYFIHTDLKTFLVHELDCYVKEGLLRLDDLLARDPHGHFNRASLNLLKVRAFRNIAMKFIELLAQIEETQKMIWEKKKFVIDTHYVITLDRIRDYAGAEFLESIVDTILKNEAQLAEWKYLLDVEIDTRDQLYFKSPSDGTDWKPLPIDTHHFDDSFRWALLSAITRNHDLDAILDGVLIHSENWQALNLLLHKYGKNVRTIYIDPPFNKEQEADYLFKVGYKDATWVALLENRLRLAREFLTDDGCIFVRCDYNGNMYLRLLMNEIFGRQNFRNEIGVRRFKKNVMNKEVYKLPEGLDTILVYSVSDRFFYPKPYKKRDRPRKGFWRHMDDSWGQGQPKIFFGRELAPPPGKHWKYSQGNIDRMTEEGRLRLECRQCDYVHDKSRGDWHGCPKCGADDPQPKYWVDPSDEVVLDSNWSDIYGYAKGWGFQTENSEALLKRVIQTSTLKDNVVMDFFLGSGTTTAVAHKLGRKWIGIEMGDHFNSIVLPRMKRVLAFEPSGVSLDDDVREYYNESHAGGFFKYQSLEQFEDALENLKFDQSRGNNEDSRNVVTDHMNWNGTCTLSVNLKNLRDPFTCGLSIIDCHPRTVTLDLIETLNYFHGLEIKTYRTTFHNGTQCIIVSGQADGHEYTIIWQDIDEATDETD